MEWISKDNPPKDDETVWAINARVPMLPIKAYYEERYNEFIGLETDTTLPVSITHWMPIPKSPKVK